MPFAVHLDCNFPRPQCTYPRLLTDIRSDCLNWQKRFGSYSSITLYHYEGDLILDDKKYKKLLKRARKSINSALSCRSSSAVSII